MGAQRNVRFRAVGYLPQAHRLERLGIRRSVSLKRTFSRPSDAPAIDLSLAFGRYAERQSRQTETDEGGQDCPAWHGAICIEVSISLERAHHNRLCKITT